MKGVRLFSTSVRVFEQSLAEKIRTAKPNQNTFTLLQSTKIYFNWLFSNTKRNLQKHEDSILSTLQLPQPVILNVRNVAGLHQIHLHNATAQNQVPTVLIHGHAASGIFFHRNFNRLSSNFRDLYTIDLPDIGLSDHKPVALPKLSNVELKTRKLDESNIAYKIEQDTLQNSKSTRQIIDYYIDSIEDWRVQNNIKKLNIVAHSFGGYLSFNYCLKYPQNVQNLILCSPVGVEKSVYSINNDVTSGILNYSDPTLQNYDRKTFVPKFISRFGFTIGKALGPFGIKLISNYLSLRYSRGSNNDEQVKLLMRYTLDLFYQNNNSYPNLKVLLNEKILALDPILDHIRELKIPAMLMYGQFDWMNANAGYSCARECSNGEFEVVKSAGHNVFLDNSNDFDQLVIRYLNRQNTVNKYIDKN